MAPPRILINLVSLSGGALTRERHVLRRTPGYLSDVEVHVLSPSSERAVLPDDFVVHETDHPDGTPGRIAWENTALPWRAARLDTDLLYFPLHITNVLESCSKVSAVRNAAPFYPDANHGASWRASRRLSMLRRATRRTIEQSERVVFMTETTKRRVAEAIPSAAEKGVVIPHGVPDGFEPRKPDPTVLDRYDLPESFLLCVSNVARYKNLVELVDGYAHARRAVDLPPLCLAGELGDGGYAGNLRERIADNNLQEQVHLLGYVDHADLPHLHAASDLFVFSSACENAPISVIEALACGDAIATSNAASMPEICGEAAAYFDPYDPEEIGATLVDLWTDPDRRASLSERALKRATDFDWEETARQTGTLLSGLVR